MAGDWIKIETHLCEKPEVLRIGQLTNLDGFAVVGRLVRIWSWFDQHTENGHASVTLLSALVTLSSNKDFVEAMKKVGWLTVNGDTITIPNWERHCSKSAKKRALDRERQARKRHASVTLPSRSRRDTIVTREESTVVQSNLGGYQTNPHGIPKPSAQMFPREIKALMDEAERAFLDYREGHAYQAATGWQWESDKAKAEGARLRQVWREWQQHYRGIQPSTKGA